MSSEDELFRRIQRLEDADERMRQTLVELTISNNRLCDLVQSMTTIEPRLRAVEQAISNNKVFIDAIKWLAMAIGGTASVMIVGYLFPVGG
jgi:hypothetical protein